ncbi:MAG: glucose 1-dehydrogenase [Alteromonadaceae bacterium]|nr:glucose 1-dehydrogenase [Alteromonadaceae bacterium]
MSTTSEFAGQVVLVTGASGGIGEAASRAFAIAGAKVIMTDINPKGELIATELRDTGLDAHFYVCDATSTDATKTLFAQIRQEHGLVDIAFNNAGIEIETDKLGDAEENVYDKIMDVNVKGVWLCMREEINMMLEKGGGKIINTASIAGLLAAPKMSIYAASKHAVVGLTKSAAVEYARKNIRINCVCPAVIETDMYHRVAQSDPKRAAGISSLHPIGRIGQADEVVSAVMYLASEAASFTTGIAMPVDGGATAV